MPGPVAAARLAELGAHVAKVEPPEGDPLARFASAWYAAVVRGQEVLRLDLKEPRERERLDAFLAEADLLLTSQRPSALERLGLGWDAVHGRFPRLCQVAIVGHAADPERGGHDLTYAAAHGLVAPPELPRTLLADLGGAERAVSAALALLLARERTGSASRAVVGLAEAAAGLAAPLGFGLTAPGGALGGGFPAYGLYRARDGWVALAAIEPRFQERLREALGLAVLTREALAAAFAARAASEWEAWARERDLPLAALK